MAKFKYTTNEKIKNELALLIQWYRNETACSVNEPTAENIVEAYLKDNDIAYYGDLRKLHGANTRNAAKELLLVIGGAVLAMVLVALGIAYF